MVTKQLDLFGGSTKLHTKKEAKPRHTVAKILHLGAGVQSSALAEMIVEGELPRVDFVIFADTGDEPDYVYSQVEYLKQRLAGVDIPLVTVRREGLGLVQSVLYGSGRFITMPLYTKQSNGQVAIVRRQCTKEYKIVPSDNYTLNWMIEAGHAKWSQGKAPRRIVNRDVLIENIYGISVEEFYRAGKRGPQWQSAVYPLIDKRMTRPDCVKWLRDHGLPVPKKSSCKRCPYHDDEYWLDQQTNHPIDFEESCAFDEFLRTPEGIKRFKGSMKGKIFLHSSCQPLRSINLAERVAAKSATPLFDFTDPLCGNHCRI